MRPLPLLSTASLPACFRCWPSMIMEAVYQDSCYTGGAAQGRTGTAHLFYGIVGKSKVLRGRGGKSKHLPSLLLSPAHHTPPRHHQPQGALKKKKKNTCKKLSVEQASNSVSLSSKTLWGAPVWGSKRCFPRTMLQVALAGKCRLSHSTSRSHHLEHPHPHPPRDRARSSALGLHSEPMEHFEEQLKREGTAKSFSMVFLDTERQPIPCWGISYIPPLYPSSHVRWQHHLGKPKPSPGGRWGQCFTQLRAFTHEMCPDLCRERILAVETTTTITFLSLTSGCWCWEAGDSAAPTLASSELRLASSCASPQTGSASVLQEPGFVVISCLMVPGVGGSRKSMAQCCRASLVRDDFICV